MNISRASLKRFAVVVVDALFLAGLWINAICGLVFASALVSFMLSPK